MRPRLAHVSILCLFVASFSLVGCESKPNTPKIAVTQLKANPASKDAPAGAVYLTITNDGGADAELIQVTSPAANSVEIHETKIDGEGMMQMIHHKSLTIKAGQSVVFEPGGYHLMLVGLTEALPQGGKTGVELTFKKAGKMSLAVPITGMMVNGHKMPMDGMHQKAMGKMPMDGMHQKAMGKMPMDGTHQKAMGKMPMDGMHQKAMGKMPAGHPKAGEMRAPASHPMGSK